MCLFLIVLYCLRAHMRYVSFSYETPRDRCCETRPPKRLTGKYIVTSPRFLYQEPTPFGVATARAHHHCGLYSLFSASFYIFQVYCIV